MVQPVSELAEAWAVVGNSVVEGREDEAYRYTKLVQCYGEEVWEPGGFERTRR